MISLYPLHPGQLLQEVFMDPHGITADVLSASAGVPVEDVIDVIAGRVSVDCIASGVGAYFGTGEEFWVMMQTNYDSSSS